LGFSGYGSRVTGDWSGVSSSSVIITIKKQGFESSLVPDSSGSVERAADAYSYTIDPRAHSMQEKIWTVCSLGSSWLLCATHGLNPDYPWVNTESFVLNLEMVLNLETLWVNPEFFLPKGLRPYSF
jgi:hypothetical protein